MVFLRPPLLLHPTMSTSNEDQRSQPRHTCRSGLRRRVPTTGARLDCPAAGAVERNTLTSMFIGWDIKFRRCFVPSLTSSLVPSRGQAAGSADYCASGQIVLPSPTPSRCSCRARFYARPVGGMAGRCNFCGACHVSPYLLCLRPGIASGSANSCAAR